MRLGNQTRRHLGPARRIRCHTLECKDGRASRTGSPRGPRGERRYVARPADVRALKRTGFQWRLWGVPGSAKSGRWKLQATTILFLFSNSIGDRQPPGAVPGAPVVPDLEVLEDRV